MSGMDANDVTNDPFADLGDSVESEWDSVNTEAEYEAVWEVFESPEFLEAIEEMTDVAEPLEDPDA